jgi:hypothetical protein
MDIKDSLEKQRTALAKSLGPKEKPKEKEKEKEETKVSELNEDSVKVVKKPKAKPAPEPPAPAPPAPEPGPVESKPLIDVSSISDSTTKEIVEIYMVSESLEAKKQKLDKYSVKQLEAAWKVVNESNSELFRATPIPKNKLSYIECLSGDVSEKCVKEQKQSKKAKDKKGGKYTRKNI